MDLVRLRNVLGPPISRWWKPEAATRIRLATEAMVSPDAYALSTLTSRGVSFGGMGALSLSIMERSNPMIRSHSQ